MANNRAVPRIPDADARIRALDPSTSFIVRAPAGSGKTELLIRRFLTLLAGVEEPENILAITFTRKAAGEMLARVMRALDAAADPDAAARAESDEETLVLARAALERDAMRGWHLRETPSRLRIQTIDAFASWLSRRLPVLSHLGGQPDIAEVPDDLYREAVLDLFAEFENGSRFSTTLRTLLLHYDNNTEAAIEAIVGLLAKRDQWRQLPGDLGAAREELEHALQRVIIGHLRMLHDALPGDIAERLPHLAAFAAENLRNVEEDARPSARWSGPATLPAPAISERNRWSALSTLLITKTGTWRSVVDKRTGFPAGKSGPAAEMKKEMLSVLDRVRGDDALRELLVGLAALPDSTYTDEQWEVLSAVMDVFHEARNRLRRLFQQRGICDYAEIAEAALSALGDEHVPTDLALALEHRIEHILVDEFQDTSAMQYELLERLTAGWSEPMTHTLFVVGDPMQSIYRFRQAEVALFLRAWDERRLGGVPLERLSLTVNFRSTAGIVDWVNATFSRIFGSASDEASGSVRYEASHPPFVDPQPSAPAVVAHPVFHGGRARDSAEEARRIVDIVRTELSTHPAQEASSGDTHNAANETVAILVRQRSHLASIARELLRAGLPFRAVEIEQLADQQVVRDLLSLTRALIHPADRISWLAVLRAPWCGCTLADLHALCGDATHRTVPWLMHDDERIARMSEDGRSRMLRVRRVLDRWADDRGRRSLRRWIEGAWTALGGPACSDPEAQANARAYFDMLDGIDDGCDVADLAVLDAETRRLRALPDPRSDGRLHVMTIHKAKGLQFTVVILPGLDRSQGGGAADKPPIIYERVTAGRNSETSLADLFIAARSPAGYDTNAIYASVEALQKRKERQEMQRLLYVACTRAVRSLHLIGSVTRGSDAAEGASESGTPSGSTFLGVLWPILQPSFSRARSLQSSSEPSGDDAKRREWHPRVLTRLPLDWNPPTLPSTIVPPDHSEGMDVEDPEKDTGEIDSRHSDTRRIIGIVSHRFMETIAKQGLERWSVEHIDKQEPIISAALTRLGLHRDDLSDGIAEVKTLLRNSVTDDIGRWILGPSAVSEMEVPLTEAHGTSAMHVRMDRILADDEGTVWIVDYKTAKSPGDVESFREAMLRQHTDQLKNYMRILRRYRPGTPVKAGLYFPSVPLFVPIPEDAVST